MRVRLRRIENKFSPNASAFPSHIHCPASVKRSAAMLSAHRYVLHAVLHCRNEPARHTELHHVQPQQAQYLADSDTCGGIFLFSIPKLICDFASMHMHICICKCECICMHAYAHASICMHAYVYAYASIYRCMHF